MASNVRLMVAVQAVHVGHSASETSPGVGGRKYGSVVRILVVDDNRRMLDSIRRGLEENGYVVDTATGGEAALEMAISHDYDLLLLDRMLPTVSGDEVCRRLRAEGYTLPIMMLTARVTVDERVSGLDTGADDYLTKPFEFRELLARMRALLRRQQTLAPTTLKVEDLELDPAAHQVRRAGRSIELSAREFSLLEYLMRNVGRVLNRSSILEHVWGSDQGAASNVVDVYVNYLRRKVESQGESRLIQTVRGVGYVIRKEP